ncbi:hypothetical protein OSH11_07010 [Kaistia dalseonensis]|uniref:Uncharacterized protein n=1 Tax=Kaistia dalseonensis TaxID=410840 RepID=A0ABU0H4R6_9HYPH|nr:hypothetical protein [Kaistia dalseonensis]MCX5494443.1 hypothetical protein [Kaistia dalseonensis]MDQ0437022.1 hypothetical protein [Kaistia dalseonensis]
MIDPHVAELSIAIEAAARLARDGDELAASICRAYPHEPIPVLRRALYYAVTDPDRRDDAVTMKMFDAAFAIMAATNLHAA